MLSGDKSIWAAGLMLQCGLLAVLFFRGFAVRLPAFTALIAFYVLRSSALVLLLGRMPRGPYEVMFGVLGVVDVVLQTVVGWELLRACRGEDVRFEERRRSGLRSVGLFFVLAILAAGGAVIFARIVPGNRLAPVDRGVLFTGMLFFLLAAACMWGRHAASVALHLVQGFGVYGAVSVAAQLGRTLAAMHRDRVGYRAWSYAAAGCYLLLVGFWVVALSGRMHSHTKLEAAADYT